MADLKELEQCMDTMLVSAAINTAKIQVLESAVWHLFKLTGGDTLNGLRFDDWFYQEYRKHLQETLIKIEDKSSSYAAQLQAILDAADHQNSN